MTKPSQPQADIQSWLLLILLSILWGGSFMFIAVAVKELSALQIVLARVGIAALLLIPIHLMWQGPLPTDRRTWTAALGMSVMNNVLPFTLITWGQHYITGGLASVINATTPMFTALFLAAFSLEAVTPRKVIALVIGLVGVGIIRGVEFSNLGPQGLGILAVMLASSFYGLSGPWSKTRLVGIPPLTTATCQLIGSSIMMTVIVALFGDVNEYAGVTTSTWAALIGLAALSTSLAYLLFFRIIARAGPSFVSLCTMIIPVFAILMGFLFLGETLTRNEVFGACVIGIALLIIDGRVLKRLGFTLA
jgi:drug/metabolite transporter (DMT)-like permease